MQKYEVNADEIYPFEGTQGAYAIYLASEVDAEREKDKARIAELEMALTFIAQGGHTVPRGTDYAQFLEDFAKQALTL